MRTQPSSAHAMRSGYGLAMRRRPLCTRCQATAAGARPAAVITGASTGIGKCIAQRLAREGWDVWAGVRQTEDGTALQQGHPSIRPVLIDVTDDSSVEAAFKQVSGQLGSRGLQALINNAGIVILAPLEFLPVDKFDQHLQVNLVGAVRVTQAFLPLLRAGQTPGRIVMMSSQSGTVALPLFGGYSASKFGLEAIADCLRIELHEQGIQVVLIKPGPIQTPIWDKGFVASTQLLAQLPPACKELYGPVIDKVTAAAKRAASKSTGPEEVATVVVEALTAPRPEPRYLIGSSATVQMVVRRLLPDTLWDRIVTAALFSK